MSVLSLLIFCHKMFGLANLCKTIFTKISSHKLFCHPLVPCWNMSIVLQRILAFGFKVYLCHLRIYLKSLMLTFKARNGHSASYSSELLVANKPKCNLRSPGRYCSFVPDAQLKTSADRVFVIEVWGSQTSRNNVL